VLSLLDPAVRAETLAATPVEHVWGIARRSAERLAEHGVGTAAEFAALGDALIQKTLGVGGVRLAHELRGTSCLTLAAAAPERQSVTVSRSFGRPVGSLAALETAVASFAARAAERARRHELKAGALRVFLGWREDGRAAGDDASARLPPTNETTALTRSAKELIGRLFVEGRAYRKAGVVLGAMEAADSTQAQLFDDGRAERARRLLRAVDGLNASLGHGTLRYGGETVSAAWAPLSERRSPRWSTNWDELPRARA
jgi:DNA polymerase V